MIHTLLQTLGLRSATVEEKEWPSPPTTFHPTDCLGRYLIQDLRQLPAAQYRRSVLLLSTLVRFGTRPAGDQEWEAQLRRQLVAFGERSWRGAAQRWWWLLEATIRQEHIHSDATRALKNIAVARGLCWLYRYAYPRQYFAAAQQLLAYCRRAEAEGSAFAAEVGVFLVGQLREEQAKRQPLLLQRKMAG